MSIEVESVCDVMLDGQKLMEAYYKHAPSKIEIDWEGYRRFEQHRLSVIVVAREKAKMIGMVVYLLHSHLHHPDQRVASCTILGVHPDHQHKGVGEAMIEAALDELKLRSVTHVLHHHDVFYTDVVPLFGKIGFKLVEYAYVKELN